MCISIYPNIWTSAERLSLYKNFAQEIEGQNDSFLCAYISGQDKDTTFFCI